MLYLQAYDIPYNIYTFLSLLLNSYTRLNSAYVESKRNSKHSKHLEPRRQNYKSFPMDSYESEAIQVSVNQNPTLLLPLKPPKKKKKKFLPVVPFKVHNPVTRCSQFPNLLVETNLFLAEVKLQRNSIFPRQETRRVVDSPRKISRR